MLCLYVKVIMLTVLFLAFYLENGSGKALRREDLGTLGRLVGKQPTDDSVCRSLAACSWPLLGHHDQYDSPV